jgi:hypothetical protein
MHEREVVLYLVFAHFFRELELSLNFGECVSTMREGALSSEAVEEQTADFQMEGTQRQRNTWNVFS